jgi:hypothetical protein
MTKGHGWKSKYERNWYAEHRDEQLLKMKAWREENPEKMKVAHQRWNATHKEQNKQTQKEYRQKNRSRVRKWKDEWYHNNLNKGREMHRRYYYKRKYGITPNDYERMIQEREGKCDLCGKPIERTKYQPCIDHDHETGKIRGLLHTNENKALGLLEDNPELLTKALDYLKRTRGSGN